MKQSLPGLLLNSADLIEQVGKRKRGRPIEGANAGYDFALRELFVNLRELHQRRGEGAKVLDEFFDIYVVGE